MNINTTKQTEEKEQRTIASACLAQCKKMLARIEKAKAGIVEEFRDTLAGHRHLLELAVNEAEALAWQTDFPQLFFPVLAVEKVSAVANWQARQQFIRRPNSVFATA